jgi:hypothetical protein
VFGFVQALAAAAALMTPYSGPVDRHVRPYLDGIVRVSCATVGGEDGGISSLRWTGGRCSRRDLA